MTTLHAAETHQQLDPSYPSTVLMRSMSNSILAQVEWWNCKLVACCPGLGSVAYAVVSKPIAMECLHDCMTARILSNITEGMTDEGYIEQVLPTKNVSNLWMNS